MVRIATVTIGPAPSASRFGLAEPKTVRATFGDGTVRDRFEFYSDELDFCPAELVGVTETQARALHHRRDLHWLRS